MYKKALCVLYTLSLFFSSPLAAQKPQISLVKAGQKAKQALAFCKQKGYATNYCFLLDMGLPSGVNRFMVWDFAHNNILLSGLVSHGCGSSPWSGVWSKDKPSFSNRDGSHCTALGKYRVDNKAYSNWGIHIKYFLTGLDTSNNKASGRQIVFHSREQVPKSKVYPNGTPEGWGCPAISNNTMKKVQAMLQKQKKHTLMWIYN